ncbi:MAG: hypothetical protein OJF47_002271 [Nitrospira sp.]|nr:MAG: hypothetical protein OJF47_002271 [Nitrospira sp.]
MSLLFPLCPSLDGGRRQAAERDFAGGAGTHRGSAEEESEN